MAIGECSAAGCYLAQQGGLVSFPAVTLAGIVDGFNPCAIGMMIMLLGYLVVFSEQKRRLLLYGFAYIASVYVTYLLIGLAFYGIVSKIHESGFITWFNLVTGGLLLGAGAIQLKDVYWPDRGPHLRIPSVSRHTLMKLMEKGSLPATIALGIIVTVLETPCSIPLYMGTIAILQQSGLPDILVSLAFLYYNLLFVLPLIVILILVWRGMATFHLAEWRHQAEKRMHLLIGSALVITGVWLIASAIW